MVLSLRKPSKFCHGTLSATWRGDLEVVPRHNDDRLSALERRADKLHERYRAYVNKRAGTRTLIATVD